MTGNAASDYRDYAPEVDARLDKLLREVGDHESRLYRGESIEASESLPLLRRIGALVEACCGISSLGDVTDVLDAIDEAI